MFDAYLFDFDGVIVNSEHLTLKAVHDVLKNEGVSETLWPSTNYQGWSWQAIKGDVDSLDLIHAAPPVHAYSTAFDRLFHETIPEPIAGISTVLQKAAELGRVGIVTASAGGVVRTCLQHYGWSEHISCVMSAELYSQSKPHPECYLRAAELLEAELSKTIIFEDSDVGLTGAKASGATVVAICGEHARSTLLKHRADAYWTDFSSAVHSEIFGGSIALSPQKLSE